MNVFFKSFISHRYLFTSSWKNSAALQQVLSDVNSELEAIRNAGTWKHERVITTKQGKLSCLCLLYLSRNLVLLV